MQRGWACGLALVVGVGLVTDGHLEAASRTRTATASVSVAAVAKLSLSASTLSFPDADPDLVPTIPASGGPVSITTKVRTTPGATVSLSVLASGDLRSGSATIPIAAVKWTASGAGFVAGTMNRTSAQSVGTWVGSGSRSGSQSYTLANSWSYTAGSYSTTLTYTLTAP